MNRNIFLISALCVGYLSAENVEGNAVEQTQIFIDPVKMIPILQAVGECLLEFPINSDLLLQLRNEKPLTDEIDETAKKFIFCSFIKSGYGKKTGHIKIQKTLDLHPPSVEKEPLRKIMEGCDQEQTTPQETALYFLKCFREASPYKVVL